MLKIISVIALLSMALTANATAVKPIYVVHINLGNIQLAKNIESELGRTSQLSPNRPVIVLRPNLDVTENPFASSHWSHQLGLTRLNNEIHEENTPVFSNKMVAWFEDLEAKGIRPEVFIINGHHLLGMGFQSDGSWVYTNKAGDQYELAKRSIYLPTILKSKEKFGAVRRFFDGIKLVFIGGCEGLANLEPKENGISGRALTPEEIKAKVDAGQKSLMVGNISKRTGLAYYKDDLVKTYPYDFTDKEKNEICVDDENKLHCAVYDVNRILPDSGLWDGSHIYNMPHRMKRLFPNALGIFGFNTPSPLKPGYIWQATFAEARKTNRLNNIFVPLLSDSVSTEKKKAILQRLRISWTKNSYRLNKRYNGNIVRNRVSGSITPAFPDLDQNGIFAYENINNAYAEAPAFAPYEIRDGVTTLQPMMQLPEAEESTAEPTMQVVEVKGKRPARSVELIQGPEKYTPALGEDPLFDLIQKVDPTAGAAGTTQDQSSEADGE